MGNLETVEKGWLAMTIFGKHTIDETQHLMKLIQFRADKNDEVFRGITAPQANANLPEFQRLERDWKVWQERWAKARDTIADELVLINLGQPLVPASSIPVEDLYKRIEVAAQVDNGKKQDDTDMMQLMLRTEKISGNRFDEKDQPVPSGYDPDLMAFKKVDAVIKNGEATAKELANKAGGAAKSNVGLLVIGGVALVIAGGVVTKVYL